LDARELENDFNRTGFDLLTDDEFAAFEWEKMGQPDVQQKLHDIMAPRVHKYYPNATRIFIGPPIKRNALSLKATNGPHMDYVPNDEQRNAFYKVNRAPEYQEVVQCLLGNCDTCSSSTCNSLEQCRWNAGIESDASSFNLKLVLSAIERRVQSSLRAVCQRSNLRSEVFHHVY
jgi:hypothetical protein